MILLDTSVVIDAHYGQGAYRTRATDLIASALFESGAGISAITLAELYAGPRRGSSIEDDMSDAGIVILDLPSGAAVICGAAYARYCAARKKSGGGSARFTPLPDFFIGAHAEFRDWKIASRDTERYRLYFPEIELIEP